MKKLMQFLVVTLVLGTIQYDACMSGPTMWAAPLSLTAPQGQPATFTYDHSKQFHAGCPTATSGNNCVTSFEFGERDLATSQMEVLGSVPAVFDSVAAAEAYSFAYAPSGIGVQLFVQPVGRGRGGQPVKGNTAGINFTFDPVQNLKVQ